jgi:hypothetical protein
MSQYVQDIQLKGLSALTKFRAVILGTAAAQTCDVPAGQNAQCIGVVQETTTAADVTAGRIVDVRVAGVTTAEADAAITIGQQLICNAATGRIGPALAATAKQYKIGIALTAASAQGDWFEMQLTPGVQIDT